MTRLQVLNSSFFLFLMTLPNSVLVARLEKATATGEVLFPDWEIATASMRNAAYSSPIASGDILLPAVANGAPETGNIPQFLYYLTPTGGGGG